MRRIFPILLALLCLAGCTPALPMPAPTPAPPPVPTQDLQVARQSFVLPYYPNQELHPITGQNRTNLALMPLVYEGLFAHDAAGVPQGVLCTGQTVSEDGLTWTFSIRTGVTFSDGSPLTPADAADSLRLAKGENSIYAARLAGVSGIAAGEGTVVLTLTSPNGNLPALLDIPIVRTGAGGTLGTGPYGFSGGGEALTLTANPGWWQKKALPLEEIALYAVQGADGLIHAFDTGAVSLVTADLTGTNALGYSGSYEVWDYPTSVMLYIGYNTKTGPCKDPAVRKALSYGYERAAVAKSLLARHATAAALPVPPESPLYDRSLADRLEYAPQTMAELLDRAGWRVQDGVLRSGRTAMKLTFLVNMDNSYKVAVAEYLASALTRAGIGVDLQKCSWEDYNKALAEGNFDLYLGQVRLTGDFDLTPLVGEAGSLNFGGYADGETQTLLAAFRAAGDAARPAAAAALYTRLAETAPFTPLCFKRWSVLTHWGSLTGLTPTQQNIFYGLDRWRPAQ